MKRMPVKSSNIASVGYDPATLRLEVEFHSKPNQPYEYLNVTQEEYDGLMLAESKGKFFNEHIRSHAFIPPDGGRGWPG